MSSLLNSIVRFSAKRDRRKAKLENLKNDPDQTKLQNFKRYGVTSILRACFALILSVLFFLTNKSVLGLITDNEGLITLIIFGALYLMFFLVTAAMSFILAVNSIYDAVWQKRFRKSALSTTALIISITTLIVSVVFAILSFIL
jgi:hypothetical protein